MEDVELKNIDKEDIEDLLLKVEDSFDIKFANNELAHIQTFGEICEHIKSKIKLDHVDDCTTQQAFYKLRNTLVKVLKVDKNSITTSKALVDFLPRKNRKLLVNQIEQELEFKLSILKPRDSVMIAFMILFVASLIVLTFNLQFGAFGLVFSVCGLWIAQITGKELSIKTVGQLSKKMTRENYLKSRRNSKTFNENEIDRILIDFFSSDLGIAKSKLTRSARLT